MKSKIKLKIADIVIQMQSHFPLERLSVEELKHHLTERYSNFFYRGARKPDITMEVHIVEKLPCLKKARTIFVARFPEDRTENWRLARNGRSYIYQSSLELKEQLMIMNETFERVDAYLLPKPGKGMVWHEEDIIYDFLQVLLINYLTFHRKGILVHGVGIKDTDGRGLLFAGESRAGKSTTARLWAGNSKASVLNDDRMIVRKHGRGFFIHGSPWHGEFRDYLESRIDSAPLGKLFFIYHAQANKARRLSGKEAFRFLYPALFPSFWDREQVRRTVSLSRRIIRKTPCYRLGFMKDNTIIAFVRCIA